MTSVGNRSREYTDNLPKWTRIRDVIEGEDAVKSKGEMYLPKGEGMDPADYRSYLGRAVFFNATGRTLDGLHGMLMRKPPVIECDARYRKYLDNVDAKGSSIEKFISDSSKDILTTNRGGFLVDFPPFKAVSVFEAEQSESYPYMAYYRAEDIINSHTMQESRAEKDSLIVLEEKFERQTESEFVTETKKRHRVLDMTREGYRQRVFIDGEVTEEVFPKKRNSAITEIPFWWANGRTPETPMLLDLADVNLAWYRKSADYENALHFGAVFMPYTVGYEPETELKVRTDPRTGEEFTEEVPKEGIRVKCNSFTHFPEGTVVGVLEFDRSSSRNSLDGMLNDEERMAILGARIISAEKKGVESAEAARIHRSGENSVLAAFANNLSDVMTKVVKFYLETCTGEDDVDVKVTINTDFDVSRMNPSEVQSLVAAWQSGAIARRDLFSALKDGEVIDAGRDYEEMLAEIEGEGFSNVRE